MRPLLFCCLACLPLKEISVQSGFGYRHHPISGELKWHAGVDLAARLDTAYAVTNGIIDGTGYNSPLGYWMSIRHGTITTIYGHLDHFLAAPGDTVAGGTPVAVTGATGRVTGPHLHFGVRHGGHYINPIRFLNLLIQQDHE